MDYLDGTLPDAQRGAFDRHLKLCPPCVAFMDQYKATIALSRACVLGGLAPDPLHDPTHDPNASCPKNAPTHPHHPHAHPPAPESLIRAILEARNAGSKPPAKG
jgi:anti-sigma factor RsiW